MTTLACFFLGHRWVDSLSPEREACFRCNTERKRQAQLPPGARWCPLHAWDEPHVNQNEQRRLGPRAE